MVNKQKVKKTDKYSFIKLMETYIYRQLSSPHIFFAQYYPAIGFKLRKRNDDKKSSESINSILDVLKTIKCHA